MSPTNKTPGAGRRSGAGNFVTAIDTNSAPYRVADAQAAVRTPAAWLRYLGAHNLRRFCIHEHAHAIVAHHFGVFGVVSIRRIGGGRQAHYTGQFTPCAQLQGKIGRLVGLAGTIAQCYDADHDVSAREIEEAINDGVTDLPAIDARYAAGYDERDIEQCLTIIRQRWSGILEAALFQAAMVAIEIHDERAT